MVELSLVATGENGCKGCYFWTDVRCARPEDKPSCLVQSGYGVRSGIYMETTELIRINKEIEDGQRG